jgi:GR25 family glycosyltransferase involved in LPS biosynthesis
MEQELRYIGDLSGSSLLSLTERYAAVDATAFSQEPPKHSDIDPDYTLGGQLFVEPQPLVLPTQLELNAPIRMSPAEIAVARSHVNVWRLVAASDHAYVLIVEDDVWFRSGFTRDFNQA